MNNKMRKIKSGFTLIELLVVVLIIGVLAAIALPMYQKAVLKSRFAALMPIVKSMNDSNEAYYLEHGHYAADPQSLPVQGQSEYPTGTNLEFGSGTEYAYVLAGNDSLNNRYIMYQKHSDNYPAEIHCEALNEDNNAQAVCLALEGRDIGEVLHAGHTTYVLSGDGLGLPYWAKDFDCTKARALGFTCTVERDANGKGNKRMCMGNVCRWISFNEDGGYTSTTCKTDTESMCTSASDWKRVTYDENGNKTSIRFCTALAEDGSCATYNTSGYDYIYDANGKKITEIWCKDLVQGGKCNSSSGGDYWTYDADGNLLTHRQCSYVRSDKTCGQYSGYQAQDYVYDANGHLLTQRNCDTGKVNMTSGKCSGYSSYNGGYDYTYDANGNRVLEKYCNRVNSEGNCTEYSTTASYAYTYDTNGNQTSRLSCASFDDDGKCASYQGIGYVYTSDTNGNQATVRQCSVMGTDGNCITYGYIASGYNYNYTYDANGNMTSEIRCSGGTPAPDGTCGSYDYAAYYVYDEDGHLLAQQSCSGSSLNNATGECYSYNGTQVQAY